MLSVRTTEELIDAKALELVPRMKEQGYAGQYVEQRREWIEQKSGCDLKHVGAHSIASEEMRGNIENPIGAVDVGRRCVGPRARRVRARRDRRAWQQL